MNRPGPASLRQPTRRARFGAFVIALSVLVLALTGLVLGGAESPTRADALCDQMRDRYGSNWPCINVPTYTPQPTQNAPTPTTSNNPGSQGGPVVGGNPGPGPGTGNGTPIVPVPGGTTRAPTPAPTRQPAATTAPPQSTGNREPSTTPADTGTPRSRVPQPGVDRSETHPATPAVVVQTPAPNTEPAVPLTVWLAVAAGAVIAGASTARRPAAAVVPRSPGMNTPGPGEQLNPINGGDRGATGDPGVQEGTQQIVNDPPPAPTPPPQQPQQPQSNQPPRDHQRAPSDSRSREDDSSQPPVNHAVPDTGQVQPFIAGIDDLVYLARLINEYGYSSP